LKKTPVRRGFLLPALAGRICAYSVWVVRKSIGRTKKQKNAKEKENGGRLSHLSSISAEPAPSEADLLIRPSEVGSLVIPVFAEVTAKNFFVPDQ
jgi:hypothetical protein